MKKIVLFGAGKRGKEAYSILHREYDIIAFADNKASLRGNLLYGKEIICAEDIKNYGIDEIIIATIFFYRIGVQLENLGYNNIFVFDTRERSKSKVDYIVFPFQKMVFEDFIFQKKNFTQRKDLHSHTGKKKVLMIAYTFPPKGGAGVQRPLKFIKYLREYNYEPVVLTSGGNNYIHIADDTLKEDIPFGLKIIRVEDKFDYSYLYSKNRMQEVIDYLYQVIDSEEIIKELFLSQEINAGRMLPDERIFWEVDCIKCIEEKINMDEIDLIWSTVPAFSQHILAYYLKMKYGIPWVADYRDLWTTDKRYSSLYTWYTDRDIKLQEPIEHSLTKKMDAIVVAGGFWKENFIKKFGISEDCITEITNGYDEQDFANIKKKNTMNQKFTLCYNGSMYPQCRNPRWLLQVLDNMIYENEIEANEICWIINGDISQEFQSVIDQWDKYHIVKTTNVLPHKKSIQIAMNADLLVFYGENGDNGELNYPGKFYEYLRMERPILCFSGHNSFQEKIINELGIGKNFDYGEFEGEVREFLKQEYVLWKKETPPILNHNKKIERFERKNLTKKLSIVFDKVLSKKIL